MSDQIPEATNNSGDPDYDSSVSEVSTDNTQESGQTSGGHPAWEEVLSPIPQEFHPHLTEYLSKFDKGAQDRFQKVQQTYAPYKELADLKVDPSEINEAMQFRHALQTNPEEVFKWMQEQYKFGPQVSQGQEETEELELDENEAFFKDPRVIELQKKANFASDAISQFQQKAIEDKVNNEVATETKAVQEKFPGLDIAKVATYALGISKQTNGMPDLMAAAEQLNSLIPQAPAPRASDSAPPVISGTRGLPTTPINYGSMSSDERSKLFAELAKAATQE